MIEVASTIDQRLTNHFPDQQARKMISKEMAEIFHIIRD
jgi:hypothetical protein